MRTIGTIGTMGKIGKIGRRHHSPIIPIFPIIPIIPIIPIFPINSTSISKINFSSEGCRVLHSAKTPTMGCTKAYCSLSGFFVRGRNLPLITANHLLLEAVRCGISEKGPPRDSTRSTARGGQLFRCAADCGLSQQIIRPREQNACKPQQ